MKQLFIAFMLFCLLPLASWADIYVDPETGVRYSYTEGETTASVTNSAPKPGAINILSSFIVRGNTYTVTSIGEQAFDSYHYLTSVTIPNSVTNIGDFAFISCSALTSVTIPNSVTTIGEGAFCQCSGLTSVTIPSSVTSIGISAFALCTGLTEIYSYIENPFSLSSNCWAQVDKSIPLYVPKGTRAKYRAIDGWNEFTNIIEVDNNIKFADDYVKALCVDNWDTDGDGELSFDEAAAVKELGNVFAEKEYVTSFDELKYFNGLTSIGDGAFYGCSGLTSIIIPPSVTNIGEAAFRECSNLTSIIIPPSVNNIDVFAFSECNSLTSITVESGNSVFDSRDNCNAVITRDNVLIVGCKNTIIPNSVTRIGNYAFAVCSGLTSITIPHSVTGIGVWAFGGSGLTSINIPNSVAYIHDGAFASCRNLSSITVESGNSKLDSRDNCNAIIETNTNTLIAGCINTNIPNTVTSIGTSAFRGCEGLTSIIIPNTVTSIGGFAFYGCKGLTDFTIPNTVTSIGQYAFANCYGLTSITFPKGVTSIGGYAFFDCFRLTEIHSYIEEPFSPGVNCWYNINKSIPVYVPAGTKAKYEATDGWKDFTNIIEMESEAPTGNIEFADAEVKRICVENWDTNGDGELSEAEAAAVTALGTVFKSNSDIKSFDELQYFTGLTSITASAFDGSGLTSITIPNSVTSIGSSAFNLCNSLVELTVENPTPVPIDDQWTFSNRANATLYVPAGSKAAYEAADYWKEFKEIVERGEGITPTDISTLADAIYVTPTTAFKGSEATLTICLKNAQATNAYSFDLLLPEGFSLVKDGDDYYYELSNRHNGHAGTVNYNEKAGVYSFAVLSLQSKEIRNNDGAIWTVKLHSADEMAAGSYAVKIQNAKYSLINGSGSVILPEVISLLTVEDCIKGDSNGDGSVDIADAVCIVNYIVGKPAPAFVAKAADANGDGVVDIADAVRIVNLIVGKINALARQRQTTLPEPE